MTFNKLLSAVLTTVAPFSHRRRRWERFLGEFHLDPYDLPRPVPAPTAHDFIICGAPRSGTSLLSGMLFQPPQVITVMEPWDGMRLPPVDLFASLRKEIEEEGQLRRGKLDVDALRQDGAIRWGREGEIFAPVSIERDYRLGVKWPAFWQYLPLLPDTKFLACVRNPFDTVNSYKQKGGRLGQGLDYDIAFNRRLNAELEAAADDPEERRVLMVERANRAIVDALPRGNVFVVHYERWFEDREGLIAEIGRFLGVNLHAGSPVIRPSPHTMALSPTEADLIRRICHSAQALGYEL